MDYLIAHLNWREWFRGRWFKARAARKALKRTIAEIVRIPFEWNLREPDRIWKEICIGTDYDGFIDPLFNYPTVLSFRTFEKDLTGILEELAKEEPDWFKHISPPQAARAICYENARHFVVKHYR